MTNFFLLHLSLIHTVNLTSATGEAALEMAGPVQTTSILIYLIKKSHI